jgi:hypothetical protein
MIIFSEKFKISSDHRFVIKPTMGMNLTLLNSCFYSIYTKVEKFMIIARAPRLDSEARRGM